MDEFVVDVYDGIFSKHDFKVASKVNMQTSFKQYLEHGYHPFFGRSGVFHSVLFDNGFRLSVSFDLVEGSTFARKVDIDKHIALQTVHRTYDLAQVFISEVSPPRE